jgi:hypothetical protein
LPGWVCLLAWLRALAWRSEPAALAWEPAALRGLDEAFPEPVQASPLEPHDSALEPVAPRAQDG